MIEIEMGMKSNGVGMMDTQKIEQVGDLTIRLATSLLETSTSIDGHGWSPMEFISHEGFPHAANIMKRFLEKKLLPCKKLQPAQCQM